MKKSLLSVALLAALSACTTSKELGQPLEKWHNFATSSVDTQQLGENQSQVVFFRQDDIQGPAVNVYINGNYQASLLPNAFTPVTVCSAKTLLTSSFSTNTAFGNRTQGVNYTLPVGQTTYVKVIQDQRGQLTFVRVNEQEAKAAISQLPKENQTLSRVPTPEQCGEPVLANAELDASALFAFNKAGYNDILPEGKKEIANFAQGIASLSGVSKLVVSGHTDPVGSVSYNQRLSQQRAETVKKALQNAGVTLPIEAVGYGKSQPVVTHCTSLSGVAKQECNQPNRRVEITVYGQQQ
ncbi:OmpA family protein [Pelistega sp. NLN82]|uniref:OmpA family protein n=1 Tax=Pelistega ratti TaxID=2652177 RepID=A0A6L9Y7L5_9BURK|nr:OmpA family protein [Pelistega ratti]NEN75768.1 OmpA family protein [Pelistega ratti]